MNKTGIVLFLILSAFTARSQTWPIHVEAERYDTINGTYSIEDCAEGGKRVSKTTTSTWIGYQIELPKERWYYVRLRSSSRGGRMQLKDSTGAVLATFRLLGTPPEVYSTSTALVKLKAGYRHYRLQGLSDPYSLNYLEIDTAVYRHILRFNPITPFTGSSAWSNTLDTIGWFKEINNTRQGAATIVTSPVRVAGGYAMKFEQRKTDTPMAVRAEMRLSTTTDEPREFYVGWSEYLPAEDWAAPDPHQAVIGQWHEQPDFHLGENWRSPPIMKRVKNGRYEVNIMWAANPVNTNQSKDGEVTIDLGPVLTDQWVDWAFHIKYGYDNTGILEVWKNGVRVIKRINMPNSFNDVAVPYFKIGVYEGAWAEQQWSSTSPGTKKTVYIAELKIAYGNASRHYVGVD